MIDRLAVRVIVAGAIGLVLGLTLFAVTSAPQNWRLVGPCIVPDDGTVEVEYEHFDPWTGQPQPRVYVCDADGSGPTAVDVHQVDILEGSAIPVPVGFALGFGIAWLILAPRRTRSGAAAMGGAGSP